MLVNTSFNVRGEPMVGTPEDVLAVGNCLLRKQDQDPELSQGYKAAFDLD